MFFFLYLFSQFINLVLFLSFILKLWCKIALCLNFVLLNILCSFLQINSIEIENKVIRVCGILEQAFNILISVWFSFEMIRIRIFVSKNTSSWKIELLKILKWGFKGIIWTNGHCRPCIFQHFFRSSNDSFCSLLKAFDGFFQVKEIAKDKKCNQGNRFWN